MDGNTLSFAVSALAFGFYGVALVALLAPAVRTRRTIGIVALAAYAFLSVVGIDGQGRADREARLIQQQN